ncbi:MAG: Uncharacterized protein FD149_695 [Rhodospirillaceae bacterium]|nr:MAG: Uncharacterized protein FD149_695 [Rhodospirillaceae bacterium]
MDDNAEIKALLKEIANFLPTLATKVDMTELKTGQVRLEADITELKTGQAKMESDITELKTGQNRVDGRLIRMEREHTIAELRGRLDEMSRHLNSALVYVIPPPKRQGAAK